VHTAVSGARFTFCVFRTATLAGLPGMCQELSATWRPFSLPMLSRYLLLLSLPLFLLDVATKEWTVRRFSPPTPEFHDGFPVLENYFHLVRLHNRGVAWGMGNSFVGANYIFGLISSLAFVLVIVFWRKNAFPTKVGKTAAALILSGICGNLLDRLLRGYVVDFLLFHWKTDYYFPAFNVADSCITVAAVLLFFSTLQKDPGSAKTSSEPTSV
jgi:signal peptidase II